jgi:hypothetical protein
MTENELFFRYCKRELAKVLFWVTGTFLICTISNLLYFCFTGSFSVKVMFNNLCFYLICSCYITQKDTAILLLSIMSVATIGTWLLIYEAGVLFLLITLSMAAGYMSRKLFNRKLPPLPRE